MIRSLTHSHYKASSVTITPTKSTLPTGGAPLASALSSPSQKKYLILLQWLGHWYQPLWICAPLKWCPLFVHHSIFRLSNFLLQHNKTLKSGKEAHLWKRRTKGRGRNCHTIAGKISAVCLRAKRREPGIMVTEYRPWSTFSQSRSLAIRILMTQRIFLTRSASLLSSRLARVPADFGGDGGRSR